MARGGARAGAGRKSTREKYARPIAKEEKRLADRLPQLADNMLTLADGGYERVEEQWAPAGSLYIGSGEWQRRMYPDKPADELVLVKRTVSIADRDRAANEYLINRIMGKPTEHKEVTGADGGPVQAVGLTLDEWRAQAAARLAQAEAALAAADEEPETDAP